ncbi:putative vesicle transport protein, Use1 [Helianthus anomalus]
MFSRVFLTMGLSKTEINFRRLLAAAPQQHHQSKLIHYVSTLRELLEQLAADAERTPEGLPRKLQEDLTDEMVGLARQLKESTLMMNQSIKNIEKVNS